MYEQFLHWLKSIDIPTLLVGGVLGALLEILLKHYISRPLLKISGSGGGGGPGPGYHTNNIRVRNQPGLLGIRIPPNTILGKRINNHIEWGLTIERSPASECTAHLIDEQTRQIVGQLWWRDPKDPNRFLTNRNLHSGESAELLLLARTETERNEYFIFRPAAPPKSGPDVPPRDARFVDTRSFRIVVRYSYGRQRLRAKLHVTKGFDGRLSYQIKGMGGGSF